jgi:tetratricopeptide (TPR) repeat protein
VDSRDEEERVRHLLALGYVDPLETSARAHVEQTRLQTVLKDAVARHESGDREGAIAQFEQLIAADADWIAPRRILAEAHYRAGSLGEAQRHLTWLTEHGVEHPRLALIEGAIALSRRDFSGADEALEYAAFVEPELAGAHTMLGEVQRRRGDLDSAASFFEQAIKVDLNDARALDGLAAVRLHQREYAEAAHFALEALEHDMQLYRAHYHLGVALLHLDRAAEATVALKTSASLNPNSTAPYFWLARACRAQPNGPDSPNYYRNRAREVIGARRALRNSKVEASKANAT